MAFKTSADISHNVERFSENELWKKVSNVAVKAGSELIEKSLWLFYASLRPQTPMWAKSVVYGALAYFVMPMDAIPDFVPVTGFADDLGVLAGAVGAISMYINEDVKRQASMKMQQWFSREKLARLPRDRADNDASNDVTQADPPPSETHH